MRAIVTEQNRAAAIVTFLHSVAQLDQVFVNIDDTPFDGLSSSGIIPTIV